MSNLSLRNGLILLGPLLFILSYLISSPFTQLNAEAWHVIALCSWMVIWWISEVVPIPVTSLLPLLMVPIGGIDSAVAATAPYAHPIIFLFFGGFCLSVAMEKTNLHHWIAQKALTVTGNAAHQQLGAVMLITAFLSMWMSNTATAVMMLPIALSMILTAPANAQTQFAPAMLLGVAYSASIGGVATLIGTPPNALLAAFLEKTYQIELGFAKWMLLGLPLAIVMLVCSWFWLSFIHFKLGHIKATDLSTRQLIPKLNWPQKWVALVFILAALSWVNQPFMQQAGMLVSDTAIAMLAAMLLFVIPVQHNPENRQNQPILNWDDSIKIPWGVLLLFGGGLSLAEQIQKTGVADFVAAQFQLFAGVDAVYVLIAVVVLILLLTEISSNTAVAAAFLPLLGPVAISMQLSPLYLVVPAALAASFAFMMPVATPPNAIVFASGKLTIRQMVLAGCWLNVLGVIFICLFCHWFGAVLL